MVKMRATFRHSFVQPKIANHAVVTSALITNGVYPYKDSDDDDDDDDDDDVAMTSRPKRQNAKVEGYRRRAGMVVRSLSTCLG